MRKVGGVWKYGKDDVGTHAIGRFGRGHMRLVLTHLVRRNDS